MRLALAISSFVVLIVHGIVFYNQFFHRWERHQTAYFDQARALSKNEHERAELDARKPRIEQIIVTQFGESRVDRCVTCHIAADDPRFQGHAHPLRTHSYSTALGDAERNGRWERRHKFSDFGCTVCHDGQGRGLDNFYSHGEDHYWPDPLLGYVAQHGWRDDFRPQLLGIEYMEANCAQCHTEENFAGAPQVVRGRRLYFESNCYGCHRIEGLSDGTLGPDLSDVGKKFKLDYLWESIVDPRANSATSFMPKFNLNAADVKALVIFLKSRRGINYTETSLERYRARLGAPREIVETSAAPPVAASNVIERGRQLVRDRYCAACHKLEKDGVVAPDLSFEGLIRDEDWLLEHFLNPRSRMPDSIMPAFRFPRQDFQAMTAYLASLKTPPPAADSAAAYNAFCARCHGERGNGEGPIALYLDPSPRDLTKTAFMNSKTPERLFDSIRNGVPGTSMPGWARVMDDARITELRDYVQATFVKQPRRELTARRLPDANPVAAGAESAARGEAIYLRRCAGCHGRKADGKGPNSLDILPRPRNLRNAEFVNSLSDRRLFDSLLYGVQGTAMPPWIDYGLSTNDVGDLVNYIRSLNPKPDRNLTARR
ncbi:MAG: c-type cytochrome [Bryobacteraceae bacterium]|nr:c-type cytochrome [Bryobacteraceae bacterium]